MLAVPLIASACSLATAKAEIRALKPTVPASQSISSQPYKVAPGQADQVICFTPGGAQGMAVTVASGGTAGDIAWLVFVDAGSGYRLALVRGGYKLGLANAGSDLIETDPVYKTNDANCCPTGGFDHTQWHWNGSKMVVARRWHSKSYKP
jgi:hypothetical protein